jgi:hypothetical protein
VTEKLESVGRTPKSPFNRNFQNWDNSNLLRPVGSFWYNQETPKHYVDYDRCGDPAGLNQFVQ